MMFEQVKITLAGFERLIPKALLSAYESFGWRQVQGADPVTASGEPRTRQTNNRKNKKETAK